LIPLIKRGTTIRDRPSLSSLGNHTYGKSNELNELSVLLFIIPLTLESIVGTMTTILPFKLERLEYRPIIDHDAIPKTISATAFHLFGPSNA
jgi:hypothetical protein